MWIITKEAVIGIVRTAMPYVWAWLLALLTGWDWFMGLSVADWVLGWIDSFDPMAYVAVIGTAAYGAIRWAAERWSWVGYLLVFNRKPHYET